MQLRYASGFNMQADIVGSFRVYTANTKGMYCKKQFKLFDVGSDNFWHLEFLFSQIVKQLETSNP